MESLLPLAAVISGIILATAATGVSKQVPKRGHRYDELDQAIPVWASLAILFTTIFSTLCIGYLAPELRDKNNVPQVITVAIPFFFLLQVVEFCVIRVIKYKSLGSQYTVGDSWSSLAAGITQQVMGKVFVKRLGLSVVAYTYIWDNFSIYRMPDGAWTTWLGYLITYDFCYYWFHREAHVIGVLWAGHSVHHNTEHYNLTTALRQSWLQTMTSWVFKLPGAFFFSPFQLMLHEQWNAFYQYWVHTCVVRRLGFLEYILMTPSHHRIHHDRRYHKNFGGMFIIWDRMFGTFLDEADGFKPYVDTTQTKTDVASTEEYETFGTMKPVKSWLEPILQFNAWMTIVASPATALFGPGWSSVTAVRGFGRVKREKGALLRIRHEPYFVSSSGAIYIAINFLITVFTLVGLLVSPYKAALPLAARVMTCLICQGLIFDQFRFAFHLEFLRCVILGPVAAAYNQAWLMAMPAAVTLRSFHFWALIVHSLLLIGLLAKPSMLQVKFFKSKAD